MLLIRWSGSGARNRGAVSELSWPLTLTVSKFQYLNLNTESHYKRRRRTDVNTTPSGYIDARRFAAYTFFGKEPPKGHTEKNSYIEMLPRAHEIDNFLHVPSGAPYFGGTTSI